MVCPYCGHNNPAENRFCGICGQSLEATPVPPRRSESETPRQSLSSSAPPVSPPLAETTVAGPSFLGLSNEPQSTSSYSYLFQDEPEPSHKGLYVMLVLLVIAGGLVYARWQPIRDYVVNTAVAHMRRPPTATPQAQGSPAAAPTDQATISVASNQPEPAADQSPAPGQNGAAAVSTQPAADAKQPAAAKADGHDTVVVTPKPDATSSAQPDENSGSEEETAASKPAPAKPQPPAGSELVQSGERYLYGQGVRKDCDQAVTYFRAAAAQQNPRALSHLGTMYAIGECVPLDRAVAYSWFSRALVRDRSNRALQRNMSMLWREMTPDERQRVARR